MCRKTDIIKIQQKQNGVLFFVKKINDEVIKNILEKYSQNVRFSPGEKPYITLNIEKNQDIAEEIKKFVSTCTNIENKS